MKKVLIVISIAVIATGLMAEGWNKEGDISLTMNQNSYSDNWAGGEKGSISWVFNANFLAEKQLTKKVHNKNTLKLAFGQTHNQMLDENDEKYWAKPDKSTDLIDFESLFRFTLDSVVDPYASFNLDSQFLDESGEETKIFNPMQLTEAFGVAKVFIKDDTQELSTRLGGAFKQYMNSYEDIDNTNDGGVEFVAEYRKPFAEKRIKYSTNLNLYKPMFFSEADAYEDRGMEDTWKQVRMDWQHDVDVSLTKLVSLKLYMQLLCNEMVSEMIIDEVQFKETLGLGLNYKLF